MKKAKHFLWLAVGVLAVIATLIGIFAYNTRCRAVLLDTAVSPDGGYQLNLSSVGEPDWPFGSVHGRITLAKDGKTLSETGIDLAHDGCQLCKENWSVVWWEDCAEVTLTASEQADEHWRIYFDGRVEQLADSPIASDSSAAVKKEKPLALSMKTSERESGETLFLVSAEDFIENFNFIYEKRNGHSYLTQLDAWIQLEERTPFYEYDAACYRFSADIKRPSMPSLSIFTPDNGEGIYEFRLTFDDHGYQEAMYREFQEMCICALSVVLPSLSEDEITALYLKLYAQTERNFWGDYHPDFGDKRPDIEDMYRSDSLGLYAYYGAGTANICIVPLTENA